MDTLAQSRHLFDFDHWANTQFLKALQALPAPPSRSMQLLSHIIAAQQLWLERIRGSQVAVVVWPPWDVPAASLHLEETFRAWQEYLSRATSDTLSTVVSYTNSKGERWQSTVAEIAMHLPMHGVYHRGQIAADLRAAGITPPYTDYIEATRRGYLSAK